MTVADVTICEVQTYP